MSVLLEHIVSEWLTAHRVESNREEEEQQRLHTAAAQTFGTLCGANPNRSTQVREMVRARLAKRHAR